MRYLGKKRKNRVRKEKRRRREKQRKGEKKEGLYKHRRLNNTKIYLDLNYIFRTL